MVVCICNPSYRRGLTGISESEASLSKNERHYLKKITKAKKDWGYGLSSRSFTNKYEVLNSNPSTSKKKRERKMVNIVLYL
jgi:hypothetical protein